jgi:hypothetical protein
MRDEPIDEEERQRWLAQWHADAAKSKELEKYKGLAAGGGLLLACTFPIPAAIIGAGFFARYVWRNNGWIGPSAKRIER